MPHQAKRRLAQLFITFFADPKKADKVEVGLGLLAFVGGYWLVLGSILTGARLNERFGGGCGILQRDQANLGEMPDNEKA